MHHHLYCLLFASIAAVATAVEPVPYGHADFLPTPERPANFRGDPCGGYPGATIPAAFSAQTNCRWKVEPGEGCGAVVVVGQRLYVQAAPNALVCLDAATGKELWRRTQHAEGLAADSQDALFDSQMDRVGEYHRVSRKWAALPKEQQAGKEAELNQIAAGFPDPWGNRGGRSGEPTILGQLPGAETGGYGNGGSYLICTTPVSDGKLVIARFPTGIVVAYDLDGKHLWSAGTRISLPQPDWGKDRPIRWPPRPSQSACPLLTPEGIVVVSMRHVVFGFEVETGKERWRVMDPKIYDTYASPVLGRIGGESFVATGDGAILRARDGLLIHTDPSPGGTDAPTCPVFADGVFSWVTHAVRVVQGTTPRAEVVWDWTLEQLKEASGWYPYNRPRLSSNLDMPSPVLVDGKLLYYGASFRGGKMVVIDAKTGAIVSQAPAPRPKFGLPGGLGRGAGKNWPYSGMTRMGDRLLVNHDHGLGLLYPINDSFTPAVACGIPDDVFAHPVAQGTRLYLRGHKTLWCFEEQMKRQENPKGSP
jgi:outer membrane protein assembly factor BamB